MYARTFARLILDSHRRIENNAYDRLRMQLNAFPILINTEKKLLISERKISERSEKICSRATEISNSFNYFPDIRFARFASKRESIKKRWLLFRSLVGPHGRENVRICLNSNFLYTSYFVSDLEMNMSDCYYLRVSCKCQTFTT